jgi:tetratricopeptide (TPR) repeat protein
LQAFFFPPAQVHAAIEVTPVTVAALVAAVLTTAFSPAAEAFEIPGCAVLPKSALAATSTIAERPAAALQRMLAQLPACSKDAVFLSILGQLLNSQGRYVEAADHLEHALMLEPDLKDAQFSYAVALTGSGDVASARALVDNLLSDVGLPADLRPLIERQKALLASGGALVESGAWEKRFTLSTRIGYDTNLLGSPNITSLSVIQSGQTLVLQLAGNYLARPAGYVRADAQFELGGTAADGARWDAIASLRGRYSPVLAIAGSTQVDLLVERSHFKPTQGASATPSGDDASKSANTSFSGGYVNASASTLNANAGTRFAAYGLSGGWGGAWGSVAGNSCQSRTGLELQKRQYLDNEVLSGRYTGFSLNWSCENLQGARLLLGFRAGRDQAANAIRPGGNHQQVSVRAGTFLPQAYLNSITSIVGMDLPASMQRNGLAIDFEHSQQQDLSVYSDFIDSGRSRKMLRTTLRVEYQYAFSRSVQGVFGAEWVGQASNIELFRLGSKGVYSGLRVGW